MAKETFVRSKPNLNVVGEYIAHDVVVSCGCGYTRNRRKVRLVAKIVDDLGNVRLVASCPRCGQDAKIRRTWRSWFETA